MMADNISMTSQSDTSVTLSSSSVVRSHSSPTHARSRSLTPPPPPRPPLQSPPPQQAVLPQTVSTKFTTQRSIGTSQSTKPQQQQPQPRPPIPPLNFSGSSIQTLTQDAKKSHPVQISVQTKPTVIPLSNQQFHPHPMGGLPLPPVTQPMSQLHHLPSHAFATQMFNTQLKPPNQLSRFHPSQSLVSSTQIPVPPQLTAFCSHQRVGQLPSAMSSVASSSVPQLRVPLQPLHKYYASLTPGQLQHSNGLHSQLLKTPTSNPSLSQPNIPLFNSLNTSLSIASLPTQAFSSQKLPPSVQTQTALQSFPSKSPAPNLQTQSYFPQSNPRGSKIVQTIPQKSSQPQLQSKLSSTFNRLQPQPALPTPPLVQNHSQPLVTNAQSSQSTPKSQSIPSQSSSSTSSIIKPSQLPGKKDLVEVKSQARQPNARSAPINSTESAQVVNVSVSVAKSIRVGTGLGSTRCAHIYYQKLEKPVKIGC